jgi:hypothetical protein
MYKSSLPLEYDCTEEQVLCVAILAVVCVGKDQGFDEVKIEIIPKESKWSKFESIHDTLKTKCP